MFEDRKKEANICTQKKTCRLEQKTVEGAGDGRMSVTIGFLFAGCLVKAIGFLAS